jgi:hypothetical protein
VELAFFMQAEPERSVHPVPGPAPTMMSVITLPEPSGRVVQVDAWITQIRCDPQRGSTDPLDLSYCCSSTFLDLAEPTW